MPAYRVEHRSSGLCFFCLAGSPAEAVERVTLAIGDAEGRAAWSAHDEPERGGLVDVVVLDGDGTPAGSVIVRGPSGQRAPVRLRRG